MTRLSKYPLELLLRKRRTLRRELLCTQSLAPIRVAVLGGSTTQEMIELLEIFLLDAGFLPAFYETPYGQFYETAVHDLQKLIEFAPSIVYIHTCTLCLQRLPPLSSTEELLAQYVDAEVSRFRHIWNSLGSSLNCQIVQNNFELPAIPVAGNLDAVIPAGVTRFIGELTRAFATEAAANRRLVLQDLNGIASMVGIVNWFDPARWFSFGLANSVEGTVAIARSLTSIVNAIYGRTRKVLALDLDNTLWGGVIGEVGAEGIGIGRETSIGQAYSAFQHYCPTPS